MLQELDVQGKKLAFECVHYVGQHVVIATLPSSNKLGLFQRDGKASVEEVKRALRACQAHLASTESSYYKGVAFMELGGNNGSEETEVPQAYLRGRLDGQDVQNKLLRALEQLAGGKDFPFNPKAPEIAQTRVKEEGDREEGRSCKARSCQAKGGREKGKLTI